MFKYERAPILKLNIDIYILAYSNYIPHAPLLSITALIILRIIGF